jgi:hypothetical protein
VKPNIENEHKNEGAKNKEKVLHAEKNLFFSYLIFLCVHVFEAPARF